MLTDFKPVELTLLYYIINVFVLYYRKQGKLHGNPYLKYIIYNNKNIKETLRTICSQAYTK